MIAERYPNDRSNAFDRALAFALLALAAAIVYVLFRTLGHRSFWYDEAYTYCFVTASWGSFIAVIQRLDIGVAFYYLAVRAWTMIAGTSEVSLRSFSVIFALSSVIALYYLTVELFSRRVALTAAALLICNSFWFQQAQTARVYAFAEFLAILASIAFVRTVRSDDDRRWMLAYFVLMTGLAASQLAIGLGLFAAHIVSFYAFDRRRLSIGRGLPLLIALSIVFALATYAITSIGATLLHTPVHVTFKSVWSQIASLLGRKLSLATLGTLVLFGIFSGTKADRLKEATLAIWTVVPIVLIVAMSLSNSAALGGRYMFSALFPFLILASHGIWQAKPRVLIAMSLLIALVAEGYGLHQYLDEPWSDFNKQMTVLTSTAKGDDAVLFVPPFLAVRVFTALHYDGLSLRGTVQTIPAPLDSAWQTVDQRMSQPEWSRLPTIRGRRLWIVTMASSDSPDGSCDSTDSDVNRLRPASTTMICLGRE